MGVSETTNEILGGMSSIISGGSGFIAKVITIIFNPKSIWLIIGIVLIIIVLYKLWESDVKRNKYYINRRREI